MFVAVPRFVTNPKVVPHIISIAPQSHIKAVKNLFKKSHHLDKKRSKRSYDSDSDIEYIQSKPKKRRLNDAVSFVNALHRNGERDSFAVTDKESYCDDKNLQLAMKLSLEHSKSYQKCPVCQANVMSNEFTVHVNTCLDVQLLAEKQLLLERKQKKQLAEMDIDYKYHKYNKHNNYNKCNEYDNNNINFDKCNENKEHLDKENDKYSNYKLVRICLMKFLMDDFDKYFKLFVEEQCTDSRFLKLEKSDLKEFGIKLGPRVDIKEWIDNHKNIY